MNPNDKKTETTNEKKPTHNVKDTSGHPVAEVANEEAEKVAGGFMTVPATDYGREEEDLCAVREK